MGDGTAATGIYTTMSNVPIYVNDSADFGGPAGGEINNEFWVYTANLSTNVYMETGVRNGNNWTGVEGYWMFWADTSNNVQYLHFVQKMAMNNDAYDWEIWHGSDGNWYAWSSYNNTTFAKSTIQAGWYAWTWQLGMEDDDDADYLNSPSGSPALIDPDEHTARDFPNELWVNYNNGPWHNPTDLGAAVTYGCDYIPAGY